MALVQEVIELRKALQKGEITTEKYYELLLLAVQVYRKR